MEKYMDENPNDIDREDEVQINKNDIKKKVWSKNGFVPLEEVKEEELTDEETLERAEAENTEDYYDRVGKEELQDDDRAEESDKRKIEQLSKELKFHEGEGVASVYVEEEEESDGLKHKPIKWGDEKPKNEGEFVDIEKENLPRISRRKTTKEITSMSPGQVTRESRSHIKNKEYIRTHTDGKYSKNTGVERDNLKTMPEFKKHKSWRQKIKDFFTKQNNEETPDHKVEQMFDYPFDREDQEPTLNDRPMDKRFIEEEEDKAA